MRILKIQRSRIVGGRRNSKKLGNRSTPRKVLSNRCGNGGEKFSEKLRALKSLLPPSTTTTEKKTEQSRHVEEKPDSGETEQLFQETADYIVRLRNQVMVLQKLIKIYGSSSSSDQTEDFVL